MESRSHRLAVGTQIGDYLLTELLYDGETARTWKATQISVSRVVIIDSLNLNQQDDESIVAAFLSDVRAKAGVDHPLIGSVFEAIRDEDLCFYAREFLTGSPLEELRLNGIQLSPPKIVHIIKQIAEANLYLEENKVATLPILPEQIFIAEHSLTRLINMAVGGERDHSVATADKHTIGTALKPLLEPGQPGSTRTLSLLTFMADLEREIPLTWRQIKDLAEEVEQQLSEPNNSIPLANTTMRLNKRDNSKKLIMLAGIGIGAAIAIAIGALALNSNSKPKARDLTEMVKIPAGSYPSPDGSQITLPTFWISSHEVTISEYAKFLDAMQTLSRANRAVYEHEDQPETKTHHRPQDWQALYKAAKAGADWNNLPLDPNCPIVGIDWWDAYAYAKYNKQQLPSQEQWFATLHHSLGDSSPLTPSPWGPVDQESKDTTANNIHGLAGNVAEWSAKMSKDPAYPAKQKMPLTLGGSYSNSRSSASTREWFHDHNPGSNDARNIQRLDLGFRTTSSTAPK